MKEYLTMSNEDAVCLLSEMPEFVMCEFCKRTIQYDKLNLDWCLYSQAAEIGKDAIQKLENKFAVSDKPTSRDISETIKSIDYNESVYKNALKQIYNILINNEDVQDSEIKLAYVLGVLSMTSIGVE